MIKLSWLELHAQALAK